MYRMLRTALLLIGFSGTAAAGDEPSTLYLCIDTDGTRTFQNGVPCAQDQTQQKLELGENLTPMPSFTPSPTQAPAPPSAPLISQLELSELEAANTTPPPALFSCQTPAGATYWSDDGDPPPRCMPLPQVGIGGLPGLGAGQSCEMVTDSCEPVTAEALCKAWESRLREVEFRWRFAKGREQDELRAEYDRLFPMWGDSSCVSAAPAASGPSPEL